MQSTATAKLDIDPEDPYIALSAVLDLLKNRCSPGPNTEFRLSVMAIKDLTLLVHAARGMDPDTIAFDLKNNDGKKVTAAEFLQAVKEVSSEWVFVEDGQPISMASCSMTYKTEEGYYQALGTIEGLISQPAKSVKASACMFKATGLRWIGGPDDAAGSLFLMDKLAFRQKERMSSTAEIVFEAADKRAAQNTIHTVSSTTGLNFKLVKMENAPTPLEMLFKAVIEPGTDRHHEPARATLDDIKLAHDVAYAQAIARARQHLDVGTFSLAAYPGLSLQKEAFTKRFEAYRTSSEKIDLDSAVKKIIKARFPSFAFNKSAGTLAFERALTPDWTFVLEFEKVGFFGVGKAFTLNLVMLQSSGPLAGRRWNDSIFRLYGYVSHPNISPCWTYNTTADLDSVLGGVAELIDAVLPAYLEAVTTYVTPPLQSMRDDAERRPHLTARSALAFARTIVPHGKLCGIRGDEAKLLFHTLLDRKTDWINPDGTLTDRGRWTFIFQNEEIANVTVPAIGPIETVRRHGDDQHLDPIGEDWVDSTEIIRLLEVSGGQEFRGPAPIPSLSLNYLQHYNIMCWNTHYMRDVARGREYLSIIITPDGKEVKTVLR